ncbi:MAG: hypothetical protein FGF52_06565 [Candidatus Brockarchaeota archaeon]|nr:hypothetical protein [Candidatus Brockarchaeota archaeon]
MRKISIVLACIILLWALAPVFTSIVRAQVPVAVWGYVYMPDGSPAAGASVSISGGGASKSTSTGSDGKYGPVTLTVSSVPVTITVKASKGSYSGSASKTGEGTMRIDVHLSAPPPPTPTPSPTPTPPPEKKSTSLRITTSKTEYMNETAKISGSISPKMSVEITLVLVKPDGSTSQVKLNTDSEGKFSYEFTPDVLGKYKAYAQFKETSEYKGSTSNTVEFYVKMRPIIDLYALASGLRQVKVRGSVRPAPETNAIIILYISLDGGSSWLHLYNTTTDNEGHFMVDVNMSISGELMFKAVFTGTETLTCAESTRPLAFRLTSEEEEQLRKQLEDKINELRKLEKENEQLRANITQLMNDITDLSDRLNEALSNLREFEETISYYKMIAIMGASASLILGLAVGILWGRKLRGREKTQEKPTI